MSGMHHPTLHRTGRHGCWATCPCGWGSELFTTVVGAHLAFGRHLTNVRAAASAEVALTAVRTALDAPSRPGTGARSDERGAEGVGERKRDA